MEGDREGGGSGGWREIGKGRGFVDWEENGRWREIGKGSGFVDWRENGRWREIGKGGGSGG
jgi:hypothetical protein